MSKQKLKERFVFDDSIFIYGTKFTWVIIVRGIFFTLKLLSSENPTACIYHFARDFKKIQTSDHAVMLDY